MRNSVVLALLVSISAFASGCSNDECEPEVYGGTASDEAWLSIRDALSRTTTDDAKAPALTEPTDGTALTAAPEKFTWTSPQSARLDVKPWTPSKSRFSLWSLIVSEAHAHLPPVTGEVFLLEVGKKDDACPFRVLTTTAQYTPNAELQSRLEQGGQFTVKLTSVYLQENRVTEGPFMRADVPTFSVNK